MGKLALLFPGQGVRGSVHTQMDIFTMSMVSYRTTIKSGRQPDMVTGLSLGEFAAMVAAGILDSHGAEFLVLKRQVLMDKACERTRGWMVAITGPREPLETIVARMNDVVVIAGYNSPRQHIISGRVQAIQVLLSTLRAEATGYHATTLNVSGAFHSLLMAEANAEFGPHIADANFRSPKVPFYSSVTGDRLTDPAAIRAAIRCQMTCPVHWEHAVRAMLRDGMTDYVEMEPAGVLSRLVEQIRNG